ncbi:MULTISPECIES: hypothetical protein [Haloprofundus]|uniref:hypothetical protein n=1 Tax=Haloprofundus TaxID=1911573 RepID=UPI000E44F1D3|nr:MULTISPECIES: hypothetical protein [Haloprofundus]QCJ47772.1 hypothetical protein FCF25_11875 [Haloprofundus sp. MHR1]
MVLALTAVLFGATFQTQLAVARSDTIEASVTGIGVDDDGELLEVTVRAENPTSKSLTLSSAQVVGRSDGEELTQYGTQSLSDTVLAPREATTFTVAVELVDGKAEAARTAIEEDRIRVGGELVGYIENVRVTLGVTNDG